MRKFFKRKSGSNGEIERLSRRNHLSERQQAALQLLIEGRSRSDIAEQLRISPHTASGYVKEVFQRFKVHTHVELITRFYQGSLE